MAACNYCGKSFDYEKYFGICPSCGKYNEEKIEDESDQTTAEALIDAYHEKGFKSSDNAEINGEESINEADEKGAKNRAKLIIALCIIIGIIVLTVTGGFAYERVLKATTPEPDLIDEITPVMSTDGSTVTAPALSNCVYTLLEAQTLADHDTYPDIPEGQKLIAVKLNVQGGEFDYYYNVDNWVGDIYVTDTDRKISREHVTEYHLEDYRDEMDDGRKIFDDYMVPADTEGGESGWLYYIVPEDSTDLTLYISARRQDDNHLLAIYGIDFTLQEESNEE